MRLPPAVPGLLAVLAAACGGGAPEPGDIPTGGRAAVTFRNQDPDVAYVGKKICASCHAEIAATFAETGMGRSWYPMSPDVAVEDFTEDSEFQVPGTGVRYRMLERDGRYFVRQRVLDEAGRELAADEREILQVVGSGNHSRLYGTEVDGRWYQMPVAWYSLEGIWDLAPGFQVHNLLFTREITEECTFCHNALMPSLPGSRNRYAEPIPAGIDCERCHGPGGLHVEKWLSPDTVPTAGADDTIVNPRRLPRELRLQVCYQCHLGGSETAERVERESRDVFAFRPGQSLLTVMVPFGYAHPLEHQFNVTGQVDRMVESRCFTESGGKLECLTCHNPHVTVYRPDRPADRFRRACLTCHQEESCAGGGAARQATDPPDDCVACHMRRAEPTDHPHARFIDHWIRRDIRVDPQARRTDFRFEPILPGTGADLDPARLAYYRGRTNLLKAFQTVDPGEQAQLRQAADGAFDEALAAGQDDADLWYYKGKNLTSMQRWADGARALLAAVQRDPGHRDAAFELGAALMQARKLPEAAAVFRGLLERDPAHAGALADLGRCELTMGRPREALRLFDLALAQDPATASLHANRAAALAELGRTGEALAAADRAADLDPQAPLIWEFYANLLQQSGRHGEAAAARVHFQRLADRPAPAGSATMGAAP